MNAISARPLWLLSPAGLLFVLAVATGCVAWWLIALPVFNLSAAASHTTHFPYVFVHAVGGTIMLFGGAANLYVGATRQHFRLHKPLGYTYVVGGVIGSVSAIVLALGGGHMNPPAAFGVDLKKATDADLALVFLGLSWIGTAAMAVRAARNRRFDSHHSWVIRSYVLVWSFVLCRLVGKFSSFHELGTGTALLWLSWIVPLFICELVLQWPAGRRLALPVSGNRSS